MFPFGVDPDWYEKYWFSEPSRPKRRHVGGHLARLAVVLGLLAGGGALLSHFHVNHDGNRYQDRG